MNRTRAALTIAGLALLTAAAGPVSAQTPAPAADGAQLYARNCASCHGATGVPNATMVRSMGAMPDFSNARTIAAVTDSTMVHVTSNGKGRMPAYRTRLTPAQIRAIVAYIRTLSRAQ